MSGPALSIVIAAYRAEATLGRVLAACRAQDAPGPVEIVVVDDGSPDATARVAREGGARVVSQPNRGPAAARNAGWRAAGAPVVLFTDSDCVPRPDWARRLAGGVDAAHDVAAGSYGIANPGRPLAEAVHAEIAWRHARLPNEPEFAGSFNLAVTRHALEAVGGFDESFPAPSGEDNDLSYRLRDAGFRIRFVRDALVDHFHPEALGRYLREQARHGEWRVVLYARHPGRVGGDGYAGPLDFAAPPLVLLGAALALVSPWHPPALGAAALCLAIVLALSSVLAVRVALHHRSAAPLALAPIAALRAAARGLGLVRGLVRLATGRTSR